MSETDSNRLPPIDDPSWDDAARSWQYTLEDYPDLEEFLCSHSPMIKVEEEELK